MLQFRSAESARVPRAIRMCCRRGLPDAPASGTRNGQCARYPVGRCWLYGVSVRSRWRKPFRSRRLTVFGSCCALGALACSGGAAGRCGGPVGTDPRPAQLARHFPSLPPHAIAWRSEMGRFIESIAFCVRAGPRRGMTGRCARLAVLGGAGAASVPGPRSAEKMAGVGGAGGSDTRQQGVGGASAGAWRAVWGRSAGAMPASWSWS